MLEMIHTVNKPVDVVFGYLTDMQRFAAVHPVITRIDELGGNNYMVHETLKLGFLPYSFTYPVTVEHDAASSVAASRVAASRHVWMKAVVMKMSTVEMEYALSAAGDGVTTVRETIRFKLPLPMEGLMTKLFRKQHALLFRNIAAD